MTASNLPEVNDISTESFDEWFDGLTFVYHVVPPLDAWLTWYLQCEIANRSE